MKQSILVSLLTLFALLAAACGSDRSDVSGASSQGQAADGEWVLETLVIEGDIALPLPDRPLDLRIAGTELGGDAGCNSMGGVASFDADGGLEIRDLFWTAMACAETDVMEFEQQYTQAISAFTSWSVDGDRLSLRGDGSQATYVPRVAPPDLPILETRWTLDTFFDGDVAMNGAGMDDVQVVFSATGVRVTGRCWTISGFATVEPGGEGNLTTDFTSADPGYTCDDRAFFEDMVDHLSATNEYRITENRLTLGTSGNDLVGLRG